MSEKNNITEVHDGTYLKLYSPSSEGERIFYNSNLVKHTVEDGMHIINTRRRKFKVSTILLEQPGLDEDATKEIEIANLLLSSFRERLNLPPIDEKMKQSNFLIESDFPPFNRPIYKYVPIKVYEKFYKLGQWQFGTLEQYQKIESDHQRDPLEGFANLRLKFNNRGLSMFCSSASNHYLFCGTEKEDSLYHREKFGCVRIRISDPRRFADEVARSIRATDFAIKKVQYQSFKLFKHLPNIEPINEANRPEVDHNFFQALSPILSLPSLFVKTPKFQDESEVRMVFRVKKDPKKPIIVQNKKLNDLVQVDYL